MPISRFPVGKEAIERWYTALVAAVNALLTGTQSGTGSPEGVVTAPQGTIWRRTDGGSGTTLYAKTSGGVTSPTDTGWVAFG